VLSVNILDNFTAPYLTYMAGVASMADAWFTHCLYILTCAAIYLGLRLLVGLFYSKMLTITIVVFHTQSLQALSCSGIVYET